MSSVDLPGLEEVDEDDRLYLTREVDKTLKQRMRFLVQKAFESVETRTIPMRAKAGVVSFARTRKVGKKGTLVLAAKIGAGIGIGLGVGSLVTPIGWAGLLITVGGFTAGKAVDQIYEQHKNSVRKKKILPLLDHLVEEAPKDDNLKKPQLAESFLHVFLRDSQVKFPAELTKANHKKDYTKPGAYHKKPSTQIHTWDRLKSKMDPENYTWLGGIIPIWWDDDDEMDDEEVVHLRYRRIELYNKWIQAYVKRLSDTLQKDLKDISKNEKTIFELVEKMLGVNEYHASACPDNCCFGPSESDLQWVSANSELDDSVDIPDIYWTVRQRALTPPEVIKSNDSEELEVAEDQSEFIEYMKEFGKEDSPGLGKDMTVNVVGGTLALTGQVGSVLGVYAFPAIGELLGVAIGEATKAARVNYPLQDRVKEIRKLIPSQGAQELDEEIKKAADKGKADALFRALRKVHGQNLKRISERTKKLKSFLDQIETRGGEKRHLHSCVEAVTLLRYYFKLIKYYEKAQIHLQLVAKGAQLITDDVKAKANRGY